jgi:hypothetical protein
MDQKGMQLMPESVIQAHNGKPSKYQKGPGCLSKLRCESVQTLSVGQFIARHFAVR